MCNIMNAVFPVKKRLLYLLLEKKAMQSAARCAYSIVVTCYWVIIRYDTLIHFDAGFIDNHR